MGGHTWTGEGSASPRALGIAGGTQQRDLLKSVSVPLRESWMGME